MHRLTLVRVPFTYRYNKVDVREEVILTQLSYYLDAIGVGHDIVDFHLDRSATLDSIVGLDPAVVVIAVRETGDNVHYALRLARALVAKGSARVVLYGQTARLASHPDLPAQVELVVHSERALAGALGLEASGPPFEDGLLVAPYADRLPLEPWQRTRLRGTIETTRGCPYPCDFCFINAGRNHDRRWSRQRTADTIAALGRYRDRGMQAFVFHDSEFVGGSPGDLAQRDELAEAMLREMPDIYFKVYARADTILKVRNLDRLRDAGLVSVFMGVESLVQADLDRLDKRLSVATTQAAIEALAARDIFMDLSFILFNRNTTLATLRQNLAGIARLYGSRHARLLGMPHFTFSFESTWRGAETRPLSRRTYIGWDVRMKAPAATGAVFDTGLEPLMEVYRLLAYEWSKKVVSLNLARDDATEVEREAIESWFRGLGLFCVETMLAFLDDFERGRLGIASLESARERLFRRIEGHYRLLPARLAAPATFATHAGALDYAAGVGLVEEDEYWAAQIPELGAALSGAEQAA
ncbi:MAG: radical SAM protein [Hyphomicrobiaceae bacterium]